MKQIDFNDAYGQRHVLNLSDSGFERLLSQMKTMDSENAPLDNPEGDNTKTLFNKIKWVNTDLAHGFNTFENYIRVDINKYLSQKEVEQVSGAVGYAAKVNLRGESLSDPEVTQKKFYRRDCTILCFHYDLTKSASDDVSAHFETFRNDLEHFIVAGTPAYKAAKNGHPKGFQLVKGIGDCDIDLFTD